MKSVIFSIGLCCMITFCSAQQTIPYQLTGVDSTAFMSATGATAAAGVAVTGTMKVSRTAYLLRNDTSVYFLANTQIASEDFEKQITSGGSFQVLYLPHPNLAFQLSLNALVANGRSVKRDSVSLNNLIFPDAGNSGFMFSAMWRPFVFKGASDQRNFFKLCPYGEFAMRNTRYDLTLTDTLQTSDTTSTLSVIKDTGRKFSSLNFNLGARMEFTHISASDPTKVFQFGITPYVHYFNVPNEDANDFYELINKKVDNADVSDFWAAGCKFTAGYRNITFFADFRHNFNKKGLLEATDLEGFVFNVGSSVAFVIGAF
jgi:hypothetical protein